MTSSLLELLVAAKNWHLCFLYISAPIKAIEMAFISYGPCCVWGLLSYGHVVSWGMSSYEACHLMGHVILRGMSSYGVCRFTGHCVLWGMSSSGAEV